MKLYVGTSGYAYQEWKGSFYPEKIAPKALLHYYGERLHAVEINYTFYHMPTERIIVPWAQQVPDDFRFVFKASKVITHVKRLKEVDEEAAYFFRTVALLGDKLGAVLLQFPASLRANLPRLEAFLRLVPAGVRCACEFRNPTWLEAGVAELLREYGASLCIVDRDEQPAETLVATAPWGYLRLRRAAYSEAALAEWQRRLAAQPWTEAFVFFKHEEAAAGPLLAQHFQELAAAA